jgi:hypothetical protein
MNTRQYLCGLTLVGAILAGGNVALAQQPAPQLPTTVQLPSFSFFTVQTTVSVPDRGAMHLGGISRGRDGRSERGLGPLANRGIGSDRSVAGASVHARIIDFEEIDRMLLAAAARRAGTPVDPAIGKAAELTRHVEAGVAVGGAADHGVTAALPGSVAAIKAHNAAAALQRSSEVAELFAKGQAAEAEGKPAVAKIFYQMVVRRAAGQLQQQAQVRLAALAASGKPAAVAQR